MNIWYNDVVLKNILDFSTGITQNRSSICLCDTHKTFAIHFNYLIIYMDSAKQLASQNKNKFSIYVTLAYNFYIIDIT